MWGTPLKNPCSVQHDVALSHNSSADPLSAKRLPVESREQISLLSSTSDPISIKSARPSISIRPVAPSYEDQFFRTGRSNFAGGCDSLCLGDLRFLPLIKLIERTLGARISWLIWQVGRLPLVVREAKTTSSEW